MAKGIEIAIAADSKAYQQGIASGVIKPTEEAEKSLKAFAKGGDKAGDEIEKAMRAAQTETKETRRDLDKLGDSVQDAARKSRSLGSDMKQSTGEAGDAVREFGDEARQNMSETFSSFRGDSEDLVGIVQDTFGGVMSNLGPVGMAAGAAGALGIGLMMGEFEKAKEREQEFRAQVSELAQVLIETGGEGSEAITAVADKLKGLATESDSSALSLAKIREQSKQTGIDFKELAQAYAGAGGDLGEYIRRIDSLAESQKKATTSGTEMYQGSREAKWAREQESKQTREVSDGLRDLAKAQDEARQAEQDWAESGGAALEARADAMTSLQSELDSAIGSWKDYQDKETGAVDPSKYLAGMQARFDATTSFNSNVQQLADTFGLTFEETQAVLDQGVDFAPMLAAIMAGGEPMQKEYAQQIRTMLAGGQSIIDGTETTAKVTTKAETGDAKKQLDETAKERKADVKATADTKAAAAQLDQLTAGQRTAKIVASLDLGEATAALNRFVNRDRVATVRVEARTKEGQLVP